MSLWVLVLVAGSVLVYQRFFRQAAEEAPPVGPAAVDPAGAGMVLVDVPWEHLPTVDRFVLTDQQGGSFDSARLHGRPYVVSFFFASCPTFCRDLNREVERVNQALRDIDLRFVTITVDPARDTTEVLARYADSFNADPQRWSFLTGPLADLKKVGEGNFNVPVDPDTHTDNILLVDKWGRYRDRFKWDQPEDMQRFLKVAREVAAEEGPPLGQTIRTRNVMAGVDPPNLAAVPKLHDFHLRTLAGEPWFSRDLTGEVWLAQFPRVGCPDCQAAVERWWQGTGEDGFRRPPLIGISAEDPAGLAAWKQLVQTGGAADSWILATGSPPLVRRIAEDLFDMAVEPHGTPVWFLVDRWGRVRQRIEPLEVSNWKTLMDQIQELRAESLPSPPR